MKWRITIFPFSGVFKGRGSKRCGLTTVHHPHSTFHFWEKNMPTTTAHPPRTDSACPPAGTAASDVLQEYADNRGVHLRVDRERGIIPGVKLLGDGEPERAASTPRKSWHRALPLYEGMRVNVDHVDPGQRRSLRDRIGLVKNVTLKEDGLYGDFHFNPKHALAEQIAWDAENAPQNLGFSHDTRGASRNQRRQDRRRVDRQGALAWTWWPTRPRPRDSSNDPTVIDPTEEIESHGSIQDLTPPGTRADRATTWCRTILTEADDGQNARIGPGRAEAEPSRAADRLAGVAREGRRAEDAPGELKTLKAEKANRELQEAIAGELKAAGLDPANKTHCSEVFLEDLRATADAAQAEGQDRRPQGTWSAQSRHAAPPPSTGSPLQESHDAGRPSRRPRHR